MTKYAIPWTVEVRALATELRAGQRKAARVDVTVRALAPAFPQTIEDCIDYQPICEHILGAWSDAASGARPEQAVRALARFILGQDGRIGDVDVALTIGPATWRLSQAQAPEELRLIA
jgi:dihydroneopterin aldolase